MDSTKCNMQYLINICFKIVNYLIVTIKSSETDNYYREGFPEDCIPSMAHTCNALKLQPSPWRTSDRVDCDGGSCWRFYVYNVEMTTTRDGRRLFNLFNTVTLQAKRYSCLAVDVNTKKITLFPARVFVCPGRTYYHANNSMFI